MLALAVRNSIYSHTVVILGADLRDPVQHPSFPQILTTFTTTHNILYYIKYWYCPTQQNTFEYLFYSDS